MTITLYLVLALFLSSALAEEQLLFVSTILRHGARNMIFGNHILTDDEKFTHNPGRLTDVGKHQLYLLGNQLGRYYIEHKKFLPPLYDPRLITVRTSALNRTIESVQGLLTGMYTPGSGPLLNDNLKNKAVPPIRVENAESIINSLQGAALPARMRIIPIHTTSENNDYIFEPHNTCKSVNTENTVHKAEFQKVDRNYAALYKKIASHGIHVNSVEGIYNLYNDMATVEGNGVSWRVKFPEDVVKEILEVVEKHGRMVMLYSKRKIKLLSHAPLVEVARYFEDTRGKAKNATLTDTDLKMSILHVSDIHLLAISQIFNLSIIKKDSNKKVLVPVDIPYASFLRFELYRDTARTGDDAYRVKVIFNNETTVFGVEGLESLNAFIKHLKANTYPNQEAFYKDCFGEGGSGGSYDKSKFITIALIIMAVLLAVFGLSWFLVIRKKKARNEPTLESVTVEKNQKRDYTGLIPQEKID